MRRIGRYAKVAAGGLAFAVTLYALMALPGLLSDQDSTVPSRPTHEALR